MSDENETWWQHALNALVAGYDAHSQRKEAAVQQQAAELEARRRARAKGTSAPRGRFGDAPKRRVKLEPDEPCCEGPRRK